MKVNINNKTKHAEQGDLIILENERKMLLCYHECENDYHTLDVETGVFCTTNITDIEELQIGSITWGMGQEEFKIIDIIKSNNLVLTYVK